MTYNSLRRDRLIEFTFRKDLTKVFECFGSRAAEAFIIGYQLGKKSQ